MSSLPADNALFAQMKANTPIPKPATPRVVLTPSSSDRAQVIAKYAVVERIKGDAARGHLDSCAQRPEGQLPLDCALGSWWHGLWRVSQHLREHGRAEAARAEGVAWIHRTLQRELAPEFHASFRNTIAAHSELLAG